MASRSPSSSVPISPGDWDLSLLPGLSVDQCDHLKRLGICTTQQLLKYARTPAQQQAIASALRIHPTYVIKWAALSDLARIPSVGCQYCGLLLHAGVSSPQVLAQIPVPRLHRQILKLQVATMQRQDLCPAVEDVARWIQEARWIANRDTRTSP